MPPDLDRTLRELVRRLLAARGPEGHWTGELSTSALSTATAVMALHLSLQSHRARGRGRLVAGGLDWLEATQNADGGWGDTVVSISNISTTALVWAAFTLAGRESPALERCREWLRARAGSLEPTRLAHTIASRYGNDKTFSVPILTVLAVAGLVPWPMVPQLPFELAALPQSTFRWLQLPVVSYALPALIAIGHVRYRCAPSYTPAAWVRGAVSATTLRVLESIQPTNGGFLEAVPLTSFVTISLQAAGYPPGRVVERGLAFLEASVRSDGSWPIDTNLATWVTTLSVNALGDHLRREEREPILRWLIGQQYRVTHPYTGAAPGAWAWTDLPGGVPDADDTSGALLALHNLGCRDTDAVTAAVRWLLDLQNRDGGIPTFCRGWGKLPFDRSSPDITAHALQAWSVWRPQLAASLQSQVDTATGRALTFLECAQQADGSFVPLWFGNQFAADDRNPVYGTARVLAAVKSLPQASEMAGRAAAWLVSVQNADGGWGGDRGLDSSIEETALALSALAGLPQPTNPTILARGAQWLAGATRCGVNTPPSPIGFYFARLWYFEALYPLIFSVEALLRVSRSLAVECPAGGVE